MKGEVKLEYVSWKCVCVAYYKGQFTFRVTLKWTQCVNQSCPIEALDAEY